MYFRCPVCGIAHSIPEDQANLPFLCTSCQNIFLIPAPVDAPVPDGLQESAANLPPQFQSTETANGKIEEIDTYSVAANQPSVVHSDQGQSEPFGTWPDTAEMASQKNVRRPWPAVSPVFEPEADLNADPDYQFVDALTELFQGTGGYIIFGLLFLVCGHTLTWFVPGFDYIFSILFFLSLITMICASCVMLQRHAAAKDPDSSSTLLWPPNFARYALEYWPETRRSIQLMLMAIAWYAVSWIVAVPFDIVEGIFNSGKPKEVVKAQQPIIVPPPMMPVGKKPPAVNRPVEPVGAADVAANPNPLKPALPTMQMQPPLQPPSQPQPAIVDQTRIRSIFQQVTPEGLILTTRVLNDGSILSSWKQSQSKSIYTEEFLRRQTEVNQKVNAGDNKVGSSITVEVTGSDRELVWGGDQGIYAQGSAPGTAAVHAGVIRIDERARIKVTFTLPASSYPSIERNGVNSWALGSEARFGLKIQKAD